MSNDLVLDLDDPDPDRGLEREPASWRAIRVPLWAVVTLVLGAALTGMAATRSRDAPPAPPATDAILVQVPADNGLTGRGGGGTVTLRSAVQVINAGPQPLALEAVVSTTDGVALEGDGEGRVIQAGSAGEVVVRGSVDCHIWVPTDPIQLRLQVRQEDGVLRAVVKTVVIQGAWDDLLGTCATGGR